MKNASTIISFSQEDEDHRVPYRHNRPLYVTAEVNGIEFKRTFLDSGASIKVMPLSVFKEARNQNTGWWSSLLTSMGSEENDGGRWDMLLLTWRWERLAQPPSSMWRMHQPPATCCWEKSGCIWIHGMHRYDAIPSTSHKVLKAIWGKETMEIPASVKPWWIHWQLGFVEFVGNADLTNCC